MPPRKTRAEYDAAYAEVPRLAASCTPTEIAALLGVSVYTVRRWLDRHGTPRRTHRVHTAPTIQQALDAVRGGKSMSATARRLGVHLATVQYWCRRAGVRCG